MFLWGTPTEVPKFCYTKACYQLLASVPSLLQQNFEMTSASHITADISENIVPIDFLLA